MFGLYFKSFFYFYKSGAQAPILFYSALLVIFTSVASLCHPILFLKRRMRVERLSDTRLHRVGVTDEIGEQKRPIKSPKSPRFETLSLRVTPPVGIFKKSDLKHVKIEY